MLTSYKATLPKLQQLLDKLGLRIDYDPDFTTATVYPTDENSVWGVLDIDGVSAMPYERDMGLIEAIEDHPYFESLMTKAPADLEKVSMVVTPMDGDTWYAASSRRVKEMRPAHFGANGKLWLTSIPELAMIRALEEGGRRRVGFNKAGNTARGTLQVEFPDKVSWSKQIYLYTVPITLLDLNRVYRVGDFQYEFMAPTLTPSKVELASLYEIKRKFDIKPLYQDKDKK